MHIAVHRLEHDLPKINEKIEELRNLLKDCDKAETKHIINKADFKGMNIVAHGDKSVFIIESLGGYQTIRRFSDAKLRSGTKYRAV